MVVMRSRPGSRRAAVRGLFQGRQQRFRAGDRPEHPALHFGHLDRVLVVRSVGGAAATYRSINGKNSSLTGSPAGRSRATDSAFASSRRHSAPEKIFKPTSPTTINTNEDTRPILTLSPKTSMPTIAVPATPIPAKVAYTVAAGKRLIDSSNRNIIGTPTCATHNGDHLEYSRAYFSRKGHATSKTSANMMNNQGIT